MNKNQVTNTILMIRPSNFGYNPVTALDNLYQKKDTSISSLVIAQKAQYEFDNFVDKLQHHGIKVIQFLDDSNQNTPDSLFPNNWISTHGNGNIFLYPMFSPNRRMERRFDIIEYLKRNFVVKNVIDYATDNEKIGFFLEGTGSMVLDRENKIAYASTSKRTNKDLFDQWCQNMDFDGFSFIAKDNNVPIYHTNVLMSICEHMVFICLDAVVREQDRRRLLSLFNQTNKQVIDISVDQMNSFLGNVLELKNSSQESFLIMSTSAFNSLSSLQKKKINNIMRIIHSSLDTIEHFGGGSARCMIAEIFLKSN
ncbi:MAG: amidinotransferase [Flavobacteriales bacterium]|nr:amidinotransferase [Flavobacteriales bacterium]|tara:strand:+ start:617 stop:1546 length:930 start_codon:yes stop_codon:yes gene_type:complete